jgi:hypothetical protein
MGFAFAFGGVYLSAREGTRVEAKPEQVMVGDDPSVLLARALLDDSSSIAEVRERLRRLMDVPPAPLQADRLAPAEPAAVVTLSNVASTATRKDRRKARRQAPPESPGPAQRSDYRRDP